MNRRSTKKYSSILFIHLLNVKRFFVRHTTDNEDNDVIDSARRKSDDDNRRNLLVSFTCSSRSFVEDLH